MNGCRLPDNDPMNHRPPPARRCRYLVTSRQRVNEPLRVDLVTASSAREAVAALTIDPDACWYLLSIPVGSAFPCAHCARDRDVVLDWRDYGNGDDQTVCCAGREPARDVCRVHL